MTKTIDGFNFDVPPAESQIVALAQYHRKQLDDAIFHQEIHLGDFCLAQRKRIYDYTRNLEPLQKAGFYRVYDGELRRLADDDDLHPADAEAGVSIFAVFLALAIIALILYFAVIRSVLS
ncbi:hypothetical protein [Acinetobacter sp. Marseille-Q1618]|uniref:hypothetical protein n=1 Tax=Acinetobacter sp. Marseille-Q1618 TaxID=2697502 RepID=UPI00156FE2E6|nr:hypothetical protein [Acinetobacter sp. Marseille-Q1618]